MKKIDWIIHLCTNDAKCDACGKEEGGYHPHTCNAHTHGMEKYQHMDFQLVLSLPANEIAYILNTLGMRVKAGERFCAGQLVSGIYEDCDIRLDAYEESGRTVLRVIIPDQNNIFPEDERCLPICRLQLMQTEELYRKDGWSA